MRFASKHPVATLAAFATFALAPATVDAQEQPQQQDACSAELSPATVQAGQSAVQVSAEFSQAVGGITAIRPSPESGLAIADPADLPRQEMAAEEERAKPVKMSDDGTSLELWLNTESAEPGSHEVAFQGQGARCTAEITVEEGGGPS